MAYKNYKDMDKRREAKRKERKKYYDQTKNAVNGQKRYTEEEIQMIVEHNISDRELSELLGRSMKAIQRKRQEEKYKILKMNGKLSEMFDIKND